MTVDPGAPEETIAKVFEATGRKDFQAMTALAATRLGEFDPAAAAEALTELTGHSLGDLTAAWQQWLKSGMPQMPPGP